MFPRHYLRDVTREFPAQGYYGLRNDLRVVARSVVSVRDGLLVPLGASVVSPSGHKEPKDTRSKVKSSSRKRPSKRSSSPALFSEFHVLGGGGGSHINVPWWHTQLCWGSPGRLVCFWLAVVEASCPLSHSWSFSLLLPVSLFLFCFPSPSSPHLMWGFKQI